MVQADSLQYIVVLDRQTDRRCHDDLFFALWSLKTNPLPSLWEGELTIFVYV